MQVNRVHNIEGQSSGFQGSEFALNALYMVPVDFVSARNISYAAFDSSSMFTNVRADVLDHVELRTGIVHAVLPLLKNPIPDDGVDDSCLVEHPLAHQQCFQQAVVHPSGRTRGF